MIGDREWKAIAALLEEGWPGEFDDDAATAWRVLLDGFEPEQIAEGIRRLLLEGREYRPSASTVIAAIRRDPSKPTFGEAYRLIFGARGVLAADAPSRGRYATERAMWAARDRAGLERAAEMHPLVAAFVARQGVGRLRMLEVEDPEWGPVRRRELEQAWDAHCEAMEGREIAAIAAPRTTDGELKRVDPLSVLDPGDRGLQLEEGEAA